MYFGSLTISLSSHCRFVFVFVFFYQSIAVTTWQSSNSNTFTLCPVCQDPHCGLSARFCWAAGQSGPWSGKWEAMNGVSPGRTKPPPSSLTRPRPGCSLHCLARQMHMNDQRWTFVLHTLPGLFILSICLSSLVYLLGNREECKRTFGLGGKFSGNERTDIWQQKTDEGLVSFILAETAI